MRPSLRPYATTGIAIVGASVIAAGSVLPVVGSGVATAQAASTRNVNLTATVLTLSPSDSVDLETALMGSMCTGDNQCVKVDYLPYWTTLGEFTYGVEALELGHPDDVRLLPHQHRPGGARAGPVEQWPGAVAVTRAAHRRSGVRRLLPPRPR